MAQQQDESTEARGLSTLTTGAIMAFVGIVAVLMVLTSSRPDLRQYRAQELDVVAATDMPSPIRLKDKDLLAVNDPIPVTDNVKSAGTTVKGYPLYVPVDSTQEALDAYLQRKDGRLQPYVAVARLVGPRGQNTDVPDYLATLPPSFRYRGYTFQQNSNAVFRDAGAAPMTPVSRLLGRQVFAENPGPEAHRNSLYVEVSPGSDALQPYVPVEKLYSTTAEENGQVGLGGQPNPYPTMGGTDLPYQVAQDPKAPEAKVNLGPAGEVMPQGKRHQ